MRCRDAKQRLTAQRVTEPDPSESDVLHVQEHLRGCAGCRSYERRQTHLDSLHRPEPAHPYRGISTERIMQAVERERRISQQLEHIESQQQARLGKAGPKIVAGALVAAGALVLGLFALFLFQPEVFMSLFPPLSGLVDALYVLAGYVQAGLTLITSQNWLLSGVALAVVIMMGMWLRLMRSPREA